MIAIPVWGLTTPKTAASPAHHYNRRCYHESLGNLTAADVYFGRGQTIIMQRERIKRETVSRRRLLHRKTAA